ncbi:MAG: hypothetical protein M1822_004076 [Bathelium mastoideum]|nr:MAG: hypothetical protein M1822_004076 [Bathelium mastoideum]
MEPTVSNIGLLTAPRYQPCIILRDHQVPYVIWFEDALRCYHVPTGVFELYILVQNLDQASEALLLNGWTLHSSAPAKIGNGTVDAPQRRLSPPEPEGGYPETKPGDPPPPPRPEPSTVTVLLLADDWHFDLSTESITPMGTQIRVPRLPALLNSLLEVLMDNALENSLFWSHLAVMVEYLYGYNPAVKNVYFTKQLKYEYRQYHIDALSGTMERGTLPWYRHQKRVRDALRNRSWKLSINSTADVHFEDSGASEHATKVGGDAFEKP